MHLSHLEVTNVRNLQSLSLNFHPRINFIVGPNGSGKTSLLESISLLSSGRSFRTHDHRKLISNTFESFLVFGKADGEHSPLHLGISKDIRGETSIRINGETQDRLSSLARAFPTVCLDTGAIEVIEGGPSLRRSILDWGMFHVEHSFLDVWNSYRTALKQKNALLKSGKIHSSDLSSLRNWNVTLAQYGERIDIERERYVLLLNEYLNKTLNHHFQLNEQVSLKYRHGWNQVEFPSLLDCLNSKVQQEIDRASALYGPHRCELDVLWQGSKAKDICSRGQKKLVLYAVRLAQIALMIDQIGVAPVLLLDDLPAELDDKNINNVIGFLKEFPCQTFITAISETSLTNTVLSAFDSYGMFHVEHGTIKQHI